MRSGEQGPSTRRSARGENANSSLNCVIINLLAPVYALYSVLIVTFFLVMSPYLAWQAIRHRKYIGSLRQRFGYLPISFNLDGEQSIWIHAVSVGEVLTARALLPQLRERYPRYRLFLSTTTMTGQQIARNSLQYVDEVFYFPFDLNVFVRRTLNIVRPRLFVMMETEIWPNLLRECRARGIKTVVINGRISSRSYPRYRLVRPLFRRVLADIDRFCMQGEESARRVGNYKWAEMRLFEVLGGWVATIPELDVKLVLGRHTYHHAWHAELWHKRLPELREMNPERLTVPPNDEFVTFMDAIREPEAPEHTIEKLVGVYRVLIPRFIAAYTYHLNGTSRITDAPTIRSLTFILQDEFEDWRDGEMLIQSLLDTPEKVERAGRRQQELEQLALASGGIAGPGSLGEPAQEVSVA